MKKHDYGEYIKRSLSTSFPEFNLVKEQYENMMGFLLVFENEKSQISFVLEKGFTIEGEVILAAGKNIKSMPFKGITNKDKHYIPFHLIDSKTKDLELNCQNIDLIIDVLNNHKKKVFVPKMQNKSGYFSEKQPLIFGSV